MSACNIYSATADWDLVLDTSKVRTYRRVSFVTHTVSWMGLNLTGIWITKKKKSKHKQAERFVGRYISKQAAEKKSINQRQQAKATRAG